MALLTPPSQPPKRGLCRGLRPCRSHSQHWDILPWYTRRYIRNSYSYWRLILSGSSLAPLPLPPPSLHLSVPTSLYVYHTSSRACHPPAAAKAGASVQPRCANHDQISSGQRWLLPAGARPWIEPRLSAPWHCHPTNICMDTCGCPPRRT
ncbi:hypothetical protein GGS23DRAFT_483929 [Durotheca rogersii]|uniref:uncharacterized protein n=1 Tax=Durotheca rogersii TaxID=419775 RepID=UPI002220B7DB|nr:uncharacterized protein GGS23DRAFT_483929 [Durotheca rogersii]KAI5864128.1 hypothetical protein GGS23DRAFT_483929 [Durotheca rogersii]